MNDAHFHLVINHMPIVGVLIGFFGITVRLYYKKLSSKDNGVGYFHF